MEQAESKSEVVGSSRKDAEKCLEGTWKESESGVMEIERLDRYAAKAVIMFTRE